MCGAWTWAWGLPRSVCTLGSDLSAVCGAGEEQQEVPVPPQDIDVIGWSVSAPARGGRLLSSAATRCSALALAGRGPVPWLSGRPVHKAAAPV